MDEKSIPMTLPDIVNSCASLQIFEKRCVSEEYVEIVFFNHQMNEWTQQISSMLGPPIKLAGIKPTMDDLELTQTHGGIRQEQTLFKKRINSTVIIAMFWPWQDRIHTTLKIVLLKD